MGFIDQGNNGNQFLKNEAIEITSSSRDKAHEGHLRNAVMILTDQTVALGTRSPDSGQSVLFIGIHQTYFAVEGYSKDEILVSVNKENYSMAWQI